MLAPLGTPKDIVDKLSEAIAQGVKSPEVRDKLETLGNVPVGSTAAEVAAYIEAEAKRWHEILRSAGSRVSNLGAAARAASASFKPPRREVPLRLFDNE